MIQTTNRYSLITVVNYELYQSEDKQSTNKSTSNQPTDDQQSTSNQPQIKNDKKEKNDKNKFSFQTDLKEDLETLYDN